MPNIIRRHIIYDKKPPPTIVPDVIKRRMNGYARPRAWTTNDDAMLIKLWPQNTPNHISIAMKRSRKTIWANAYRLRLCTSTPWGAFEMITEETHHLRTSSSLTMRGPALSHIFNNESGRTICGRQGDEGWTRTAWAVPSCLRCSAKYLKAQRPMCEAAE